MASVSNTLVTSHGGSSYGVSIRDAEDVIKRCDRLVSDRLMFDILAQDLATYIMPHRQYILFKLSPGAKQTSNLYDTTAVRANQFLASSMAGTLTPSGMRWFSLKMVNEDLNNDHEVLVWLDDVSTRIFAALNHSNFKSESHELYLDLGCFGSACLLVEEIPGPRLFNGLRFRTEPYSYYAWDEGADGYVDTVARKIDISARAARVHPLLSKGWNHDLERIYEGSPDQMLEVLNLCQPRENGKKGARNPENRPYADYYVERKTRAMLYTGGKFENPWLTPRWSKSSGEKMGRGPGHIALPDVKTINKARELRMRYAAKVVDPPLGTLDDSVISRVRTAPAAITPVRTKDAIFSLWDARSGSHELGLEFEKELQQAIRAGFYSDILQIPEKQYQTATEVQAQQEQLQRALGPTLGRLENEFLSPLLSRVFAILFRAGVLPPLPDAIKEAEQMGQQTTMGIVYEGPLARSQRFSDLASAERMTNIMTPIYQISPTTKDIVNWDDYGRFIWEATALPEKLMNSPAAVEESRKQQAAQMEQQNQLNQTEQMAGAAGKAAPMVKAIQDGAPQGDQSPDGTQ